MKSGKFCRFGNSPLILGCAVKAEKLLTWGVGTLVIKYGNICHYMKEVNLLVLQLCYYAQQYGDSYIITYSNMVTIISIYTTIWEPLYHFIQQYGNPYIIIQNAVLVISYYIIKYNNMVTFTSMYTTNNSKPLLTLCTRQTLSITAYDVLGQTLIKQLFNKTNIVINDEGPGLTISTQFVILFIR